MSRRAVPSGVVTTEQPSLPAVHRDAVDTVHLSTDHKQPHTAATTISFAQVFSILASSAPPSSAWRRDRPARVQPNYALPSQLASTPLPAHAVAAIFLSFPMQVALMFMMTSAQPFRSHLPLLAVCAVQTLVYFALACLSRLSPLACLLLSPAILVCPSLYPSTFPFLQYVTTISALTYWPHLVDLYRYRRQFARWSVWLRCIFVLSYVDLRDGVHITESTTAPQPPTAADETKPAARSASWATLRPLMVRDVMLLTMKEVPVAICGAALYFLPYASFFPTAKLLLTQPLSSAALVSLATLYARYLSLFLLLTSALTLIDHVYSLLFLCLSLHCTPSQHSPLTAHSLSSFWAGRWNRNVHQLLYHAVYLPVLRATSVPAAAVVAAFAGSAFLHAYPGWVAGMTTGGVSSVVGFFLAHGALTLLERAWLRRRRGEGEVTAGGEPSGSWVWSGRVWVWSCILLSLPLACEPFFSRFGSGGNAEAMA